MRCTYCGNENPEGNRFCGMCGVTLLTEKVPVAQNKQAGASGSAVSALSTTAGLRTPDPARAADPSRPVPPAPTPPVSISGPSFLGLGDPAPTRAPESPPQRTRDSLSIAPDSAGTGNLDYLLVDDEEPRSSAAGKVLLILFALALAAGLGYLRWKNHGFPWLSSAKPSAAQTTPDTTASDASTPVPSSGIPAVQTPSAQPVAAATQADKTTEPLANSAVGNAAAASNPAVTAPKPDGAGNPASSPDASPSGATPAPTQSPAASATDSSAKESVATSTPPKKAAPSSAGEAADAGTSLVAPPAKPAAATTTVPRIDPVMEAQKYLYGRGAAQDCDRGLRLLRAAADKADPKAMIEMGALYSAGLCTPHDLPTAYRWFSLALRKDPGNQAASADLTKLWGEMTQPERQLAIRMTQ